MIEKIIYTPLDEVADTLKARKNDEELQDRLLTLIGNDPLPNAFSADNAAVFAEYIARPTGDDLTFASQAMQTGLQPWWVTYETDAFTNANAKKVSMWRPPLALPKGQDIRQWIVAADDRTATIGEASTKFGGNVVEYWRDLRQAVFNQQVIPEIESNVCDIGEWYKRQAAARGEMGKSIASAYYPAVMGLYAAKAALFCNFDNYPEFYPIALEGFKQASATLGVRPIIVAFESGQPRESVDGRRLLDAKQTDLTWLDSDQTASLLSQGIIKRETL